MSTDAIWQNINLAKPHGIVLENKQIDLKTCFLMIYFLLKSDRYAPSYGFLNF